MRGNSSNPVNNAVGIQRQFSKQPQGEYVKRLQGLNLGTPQVGMDLKGETLARALGVLGGALNDEEKAHEKRVEKYGIDAAERTFAAMTAEDREKLNAMSALSQYGYRDMIDNPYAVSMLDKLRGQALDKSITQEFSAAVERGEYRAKTSQERAKQFEDFRKSRLETLSPQFDNAEAFNKGFNEAHPLNLVTLTNQFLKIKNQEYELETYNTMRASADNLISSLPQMSPAAVKTSLQFFANTAQGMGMKQDYLYAIYNHFGKTLSDKGLPQAFDAFMDTDGFVDGNGNPIKIKHAMPMEAFRTTAGVQAVNLWKEEEADTYRMLEQSATKEDLRANFIQLPQRLREALEPHLKSLEDGIIRRNNKLAEETAKAQADSLNYNNQATQFHAIIEAITDGHSHILGGTKPVTATTWRTIEGKEKSWDEAVVNTLAQEYEAQWATMVANGQMSNEEHAARFFQLYESTPLKASVQARKDRTVSALNGIMLTADQQDTNGNFIIPPQLQRTINLRRGNPGRFDAFFGDTVAEKLQLLEMYQKDAGDEQKGYNMWVQAQSVLSDPKMENNIEQRLKKQTPANIALSVIGTEGNWIGATRPITVDTDPVLSDVYSRVFSMYATKLGDAEAKAKATEFIKENYKVFDNYAIPKAFFGGLDDTTTSEVLSYYKEQQRSKFGKDNIVVTYNHTTNEISITNSMLDTDVLPLNIKRSEWRNYVQKYLDTKAAEAALSYEDMQKAREHRQSAEVETLENHKEVER